jgi:hypothetical protein
MKPRGLVAVGVSVLLGTLFLSLVGWLSRTGQLTIFGDTSPVVNLDVSLFDRVDRPAIEATSASRLSVQTDGLALVDSASRGTTSFTVGQRELIGIHRLIATFAAPPPAGSQVTVRFAGSPDGVSFSAWSPPQAIVPGADGSTAKPVELDFLIPVTSRFVQVELTLERAATGPSPVLAQLAINVSQGPIGDPSTNDHGAIQISTAAEHPAPPTPAGRPAELVVTGLSMGSIIGALGIGLLIWLGWRLRHQRAREAHGRSDATP